jgi:hypothetical protein
MNPQSVGGQEVSIQGKFMILQEMIRHQVRLWAWCMLIFWVSRLEATLRFDERPSSEEFHTNLFLSRIWPGNGEITSVESYVENMYYGRNKILFFAVTPIFVYI